MNPHTTARATPAPNGKRNHLDIVGRSPQIEELRRTISRVATTNVSVLITGERGTGKELVARAIHRESLRRVARFVAVNCAAIPAELVESELFGHVKGSFTGAIKDRKGKFQLAREGTLFLDEIGDMPLTTQAKLLRVLELGEFEAVGGSELLFADVRIVSATNKDLEKEIADRKFREDLYDRLNVVEISVLPLRERLEDLPLLVEYFLRKFNEENRKEVEISREALLRIEALAPNLAGNIRSLKALIERAAVFADTGCILPDNRAFSLNHRSVATPVATPVRAPGVVNEESIREAIRKYGPFKFTLHESKRTKFPRRIAERIADAHGVAVGQIQSFLAASGSDLRKLIKDERRSLMLNALARKLTGKQLADELGITQSTVKYHADRLGIRISAAVTHGIAEDLTAMGGGL